MSSIENFSGKCRCRVSVIVPIFNAYQSIDSAFLCLSRQTLHDMEFIIVDDASTDESRKKIRKFLRQESRARAIYCEQNGKSGAARNCGLLAAHGEYFGFFDFLDVIPPNFFETLLRTAEDLGSDIAACPVLEENAGSLRELISFSKVGYFSEPSEKFSRLCVPKFSFCCNKIARRDYLGGIRFREGVRHSDIDYTLRILSEASGVALTDCTSYVYRGRSSGDSSADLHLALSISARLIAESNLPVNPNSLVRNERKKFLGLTLLRTSYQYGGVKMRYLFDILPIWRSYFNIASVG